MMVSQGALLLQASVSPHPSNPTSVSSDVLAMEMVSSSPPSGKQNMVSQLPDDLLCFVGASGVCGFADNCFLDGISAWQFVECEKSPRGEVAVSNYSQQPLFVECTKAVCANVSLTNHQLQAPMPVELTKVCSLRNVQPQLSDNVEP